MAFLLCCHFAHLWINQGLPQTVWKRKVKVDLVFLPFVLSLVFPAALLTEHSAEVKPQEEMAVLSSHCSQGADLALVPTSLLALAQHATCSAKQEGSLHFIFYDFLVADCGDDGTSQ